MKLTAYTFLLCFFSANAFAAVEEFRAVNSVPHMQSVEIRIQPDPKSAKRCLISYKKMGSERIEKKFPQKVANDLLDKLWAAAPEYAEWTNDEICLHQNTWYVSYQEQKKQVCSDKKTMHALKDMQRAISKILKN